MQEINAYNKMKELKIYEYQAKTIEDALRLAARQLDSHGNKTCMDRTIMQAYGMIQNILAGKPEEPVLRKFS